MQFKSLLPTALITLSACASAQSSVTLYGVLDEALAYASPRSDAVTKTRVFRKTRLFLSAAAIMRLSPRSKAANSVL